MLDGRREVEVVRMEAGGVAGRAFLGKLVAMRIGSSESRKWEAMDGRARF